MRLLLLLLIVAVTGCKSGAGGSGAVSRLEWAESCERLIACRPGIATLPLSATQCAAMDPTSLALIPASFQQAARCANAALGDCDAILACWNGEMPSSGCDPAAVPYCLPDGSQWACVAGVAFVRNCVGDELTCLPGAMAGAAACGTADCAAGFATICSGDQVIRCDEVRGIAAPVPCGEGQTCGQVDGVAACTGTGVPCLPGQVPRCADLDTLVTCVGGKEAVVECAAGGYRRECETPGVGAVDVAACKGVDDECDASTFVDRCNGARLEYCEDGRVRGLDCRAMGFLGCLLADPVAGLPSRCESGASPPMPDAGLPDAMPADASFDAAP